MGFFSSLNSAKLFFIQQHAHKATNHGAAKQPVRRGDSKRFSTNQQQIESKQRVDIEAAHVRAVRILNEPPFAFRAAFQDSFQRATVRVPVLRKKVQAR